MLFGIAADMPADKGKKGGKCNRTACPNRPAECWSSVEQAFYCVPCAHRINVYCPPGVPRIEIPPSSTAK